MRGLVGAVDQGSIHHARQTRLRELSTELCLVAPSPVASPLPRPSAPQNVRTDKDEFYAEELLKRWRSEEQNLHGKGGISRAFSAKKRAWEYKEIYGALVAHVTDKGSPSVAEALISKLTVLGGNVNLAQKSRTSLITRRKSLDLAERSKVLQKAVENRHKEMVQVLLPYADALSLDTSLPIAFRNRDPEIVKMLIQYGASAFQTGDGQDAFRQACVMGGNADMLATILGSDGKPPVTWVSQSMVDAARAGCLDSVMILSQASADGNNDQAAALKTAVALGRRDIALAIVTGSNPPKNPGVSEAFEQLMGHQNISPNEKTKMAEILLCAGADGEPVARALVQASSTCYLELVSLLVSYGASIEYHDAIALRRALSNGRSDLAELLLSGRSPLSSVQASECVQILPQKLRFEERYSLLSLLLRKGAQGPPLDGALVDVADVGDSESASLLLEPLFPGGEPVENGISRRASRGMVYERHAVASTNSQDALALQLAIKNGHFSIAKLILNKKPPTDELMTAIFPTVISLPQADRLQMTEAFLGAGLTGSCISTALENAIGEQPRRDEQLIGLLLRSNADVNSNEGATLAASVEHGDVNLLHRLLKNKPTPQVLARTFSQAVKLGEPAKRFQMVNMLIGSGASLGGPEVSASLVTLLKEDPADKILIRTVLKEGGADVNWNGGAAISCAVKHSDPDLLELVLAFGHPNPEELESAMKYLAQIPTNTRKADKLDTLLRHASDKTAFSTLLVEETKNILMAPPNQRDLSVLKTLLDNGADVNINNGEAFCRAVRMCDEQMVDLMFTSEPAVQTLAFAMPQALKIPDLMDRLFFSQKILKGNISPVEVNRALYYAISTYPEDLPLINALLSRADTADGSALFKAIQDEKPDIVDLVLGQKEFAPEILNAGFVEATKTTDKRNRRISCSSLLRAGASGDAISDALVTAASDGDLLFGTILVEHGGDVEHKNGMALAEACRTGSFQVLEMLLSGQNSNVSQETLQAGFQAATGISDLAVRASIFRLLLERGVTGEVLDTQLVSAVRFLDSGTDLVQLLLFHGASPDYNSGEAVEKAARSGHLENLGMLLGVSEIGGQQKKPSSATLVQAMDACWELSKDSRFTVFEWIFKAGKPAPSRVHDALTRAVKEEDPEERLMQLLVANRASPTANNCQTLIDGARTLSPLQYAVLLEHKITAEEASLVFEKACGLENVDLWLSERGYEICCGLLEKGACSDAVGHALTLVLGARADKPEDLTDSFVELLLKHEADVDYNHGEALQIVAAEGNAPLLERLLQQKPNSESLTLAFPRILEASLCEDDVNELISLFVDYRDSENQVDVMFVYPGSKPVIVQALSQFPRSTKILQSLLDLGYYHDQTTTSRVIPEIDEEEQVTLLMWALLQPQKQTSSGIINLLVERGAKVNFETRASRVTPLMVAIQERRPDIVKLLLLAGAEADIADALGRSPLSLASAIGGDLAITIMSNLLAAGASRNDGSLHNVARELNLQAMQILIEFKHEPDFPSPQHGGRSALGELCLHAADSADSGVLTAARERVMEKAMNFLLEGSDIMLKSDGKSALILALESADPVTTTRVLLRADMWKFINKPFNQFTDGSFTYSPTQYVKRVLARTDRTEQLVRLLKANRGTDVFYANSGPQPEDAVGMPPHIELEEQERKSRLDRIAKDSEDHALAISRTKELATIQSQIWTNQAELEDARKKRSHNSELSHVQERVKVEEELFNKTLAQQRMKQSQDMAHQQSLTVAALSRAQTVGDAELARETERQNRVLKWERDLGNERVGNANQLSTLRLREREEMERMDNVADGRIKNRLREQKKLVDSQNSLATNLKNGGGSNGMGMPGVAGRRPMGYISDELN